MKVFRDPFPAGSTHYQMFFECTVNVSTVSNVCTALSEDGLTNWLVWSRSAWTLWTNAAAAPIPGTGEGDCQGFSTCGDGTGYPSAIVMGNEIWLYFCSQNECPAQQHANPNTFSFCTQSFANAKGVVLLRTSDGINLSTVPDITNLELGAHVYAVDINNGYFMATGSGSGNDFILGTDGVIFESPLTGRPFSSHPLAFATSPSITDGAAMVSDPYGHLPLGSQPEITFISSEGGPSPWPNAPGTSALYPIQGTLNW